jgi:hypothetical protein
VAATVAFRDEMRDGRSPAQLANEPGPFGFRRNGLICFVARLANRMNYSLRRDA